jgi:hypothetical protein
MSFFDACNGDVGEACAEILLNMRIANTFQTHFAMPAGYAMRGDVTRIAAADATEHAVVSNCGNSLAHVANGDIATIATLRTSCNTFTVVEK